MEVAEAQRIIAKAYLARDRARGVFGTFAWLVEEVGELAEALLSGDRSSIEQEIADVFAWLLSVANLVGVDVEEAFKRKYSDQLGGTREA